MVSTKEGHISIAFVCMVLGFMLALQFSLTPGDVDDLADGNVFTAGEMRGHRERQNNLTARRRNHCAVQSDTAQGEGQGVALLLPGVVDCLAPGEELPPGRPVPKHILIHILQKELNIVLIVCLYDFCGQLYDLGYPHYRITLSFVIESIITEWKTQV